MEKQKCDFSGWATVADVLCTDGRVIKKDAFQHNDGKKVPLLWNHNHSDPFNVLGYTILQHRDKGMYCYGYFNDSEEAEAAKRAVRHGDIDSLSIHANHLVQKGSDVLHGEINEVSLVYAGANKKAFIDVPVMSHSDEDSDFEGIIFTGLEIEHSGLDGLDVEVKEEEEKEKEEPEIKEQEDEEPANEEGEAAEMNNLEHADQNAEPTVGEVIETMDENQKEVLYGLVKAAAEAATEAAKEGDNDMKHNAFDDQNQVENDAVLTHSDMVEILKQAKKSNSLRDTFNDYCLEHSIVDHDGNTITYGIANIDYLFPEAKKLNNPPEWINRKSEWVSAVMGGVHHTPFSRIKSMFADITGEDARALGYIKGNMKKEEVFELLKRETTPQTIYKKQKLDRDDIIDITDLDVVAWLKGEMRMKLDEEIARAILIGDGRSSSSPDRINPNNVRPIWTDADLFTIKKTYEIAASDTEGQAAKKFLQACIRSRKEYRGSGNPVMFMTEDTLTELLLMEDLNQRVIYDTEEKLRTALRVSKIVTVPYLENQTRTVDGVVHTLKGIYVNLNDYNVGADKGGAVSMFEDFDIDYNQEKYLIETRISGAMIKPYAAVVIESIPEPAE